MSAPGSTIEVLVVRAGWSPLDRCPSLEHSGSRLSTDATRDAGAALDAVRSGAVDCVVSAHDLPDADGVSFLASVRERDAEFPFVLIPRDGTQRVASAAVRNDVTEYVPTAQPDDEPPLRSRIVDRVEAYRSNEAAKREATANDRRFDAVFEDPKMLVGLLDPDGALRRANDTAMSYLDVDHEAVVGKPFWEAPWWSVSSDLQADVRGWIERAADGEYVEYETGHYGADGHEFTVSGTVRPVTDADGAVTSLVASAHDVTERKRREYELERYEALTKQSSDILTVLDRDGVIRYQSPSVERILGWDQFELVGESAYEYVHPEDRDRIVETLSDLVTDAGTMRRRVRYRMHDADGEWRWLESTGSNRTDTAIDGYVITSRDVTERKRYEETLERTNERLEAFARIVSHDLRNPLNVLSGSLELAEETGDVEHVRTAQHAADRMDELIEDLLTLARDGESIDEIEDVSTAALAERCWETVATADADLVVDTDATIRADRSRLRQLLENCFRNAVEHGGEEVTVTLGGIENGFYVADDGEGFAVDDRGRLLETGASTTGGTGIGLAIVDDVATAHDWSVELSESDAGGARIEITNVELAA